MGVKTIVIVGGGFAGTTLARELDSKLPKGYELVGSASPGIVSTGPDGRVRVSFLNDRDDQLPVRITGRKLP